MRRFRFATERKNLRVNSSVKLNEFESAHALNTLRLKKGDEIYLFNGEKEFRAELKMVTKEAVMAEILEEVKDLRNEERLEIDLYIGITRTKTLEEVFEKLTELGVTKFLPMECEYSVIKLDHIKNKYERWNKIIMSACKQSERIIIPELAEGLKYSDAISNLKDQNYDKIYFMSLRQSDSVDINTITKDKLNKIAIIIGPEGGFSPKEHSLATENNLIVTEIPGSVLRVETAAIVSVCIAKYLHE